MNSLRGPCKREPERERERVPLLAISSILMVVAMLYIVFMSPPQCPQPSYHGKDFRSKAPDELQIYHTPIHPVPNDNANM
jgi:hypothetical protein